MPNITALPARPDTAGLPPTADEAAQGTDGWAQNTWDTINNLAHHPWAIYGLAGTLAVLLALSLRSRRKRTHAEAAGHKADLTRTDRAVTLATGILATAVVATGAWKVFGDVLHLHPAIRLVLFFFAEAQIIAAWRRVRRHIYRHAVLGPGIRTIYGIALGSALVAAFDADGLVEVLLRFFAASVAAYMIAEELAEELDIYLTANPHLRQTDGKKPRGRIKWAVNAESILVWLRLAQATERDLEDVERQRRIARFARTAYRLHLLKETAGDNPGRIRRARIGLVRWQQRRQTEAANEHLALATDPDLLADVRAQLALLYGVEGDTSRRSVGDLRPLRPAEQLALASVPFFAETPRERPDLHPQADTRIADPDPSQPTPAPTQVDSQPAPIVFAMPFAAEYPQPSQRRTLRPSWSARIPARRSAPIWKRTANPAEKPADSSPERTAERPAVRAPRPPRGTVADEVPASVRKLASAFARKPSGTNAELAKLAKVSIGSANRHLPQIRAAATSQTAKPEGVRPGSQKPSQSPLISPLIEHPRKPVKSGANGSTFNPQGDHS